MTFMSKLPVKQKHPMRINKQNKNRTQKTKHELDPGVSSGVPEE